MFEESQPVRPMTEEEIKFEKMTKQIEKLEKLVGALAVTNFLTQHEDGDEEVREQSVEKVNEFARRFKDQCIKDKKIEELEAKKWSIDQEIESLKWGTLTYKTSERYGLGFNINNQTLNSAAQMSIPVIDIQQERMNAFNASAARAEAVAVLQGGK